jgi:hypothetical protein
MKKIIIFISLISLLGLSACSGKKDNVTSVQETSSPEPTKSVEKANSTESTKPIVKANPSSTPISIESETQSGLKKQDVKNSTDLVEKVITQFKNITSYSFKEGNSENAVQIDVILDNNQKIKELLLVKNGDSFKWKDGKAYAKIKSESNFKYNEAATKLYKEKLDLEILNTLSNYIKGGMENFKASYDKYKLEQENDFYIIKVVEKEGKSDWIINKEYQIVKIISYKGNTIDNTEFYNYNEVKSID